MRRLRATRNEVALSLFPFLAVLICTMGALIVLLVVVVRNAKLQAEEIATATDSQQQIEREQREAELAELQRQREDNLWRLDMLATQRQEMTKELDRRRLELSHLEEHHRRLAEQLEQKLKQAASFDQLDQATQQDQQALANELARLRQAIAAAEQDLAKARKQVSATQQGYALLPYDGPNGTRRRPIYIECTEQAVVIQPEGIALSARDFSGPLGAGNPLDAALRAARESMATSGVLKQNEEPYPLLVVRPGGSISYAAARAAMTSWDNEFGYELIDADMKLAYGDPDPQRAKMMARAIDEARQRTDLLRAAAPARFEGTEILSFSEAAATGGDAGGTGLGGGSHGSMGNRGSGGRSNGLVGGSAERSGQYGSRGADSPGFSGGRGYPEGNSAGYASGGSPGGRSGPYGSDGNYGADGAAGASQGNATGQGGGAESPGREQYGSAGGSSGQRSADGSSAQSGQPQFQQRIANSRGANWAVAGASSEATGYNRPISIICHPDHIEIPAVGDMPMQTIPFLGATGNAAMPLVERVTQRVNSWGIAGRGAYWKPVLVIEVKPGAEQRFQDLQMLLDRSGLELERK